MNSLKKPSYGDCVAAMILAAPAIDVPSKFADNAKRQLQGESIHPMVAAAMEKESIRLNELARSSPERLKQANELAMAQLKSHGFALATH